MRSPLIPPPCQPITSLTSDFISYFSPHLTPPQTLWPLATIAREELQLHRTRPQKAQSWPDR